MALNLEDYVSSIPDFPKEGILFRDVTSIIQDGEAFRETINQLVAFAKSVNADFIVGPEARGFIFGAPVAVEMGIGFAPVRKPGKLPREAISCKYDLEYGSNEVCLHKDAIQPGARVVVIDDLLETGGTAESSCKMIEQLGGTVAGCAFVIELYGNGMAGREVLKNYEIFSILKMSDN